MCSWSRGGRASGRGLLVLADAEHDELGGLDRRDADLDHELAGVDRLRRVRRLVAADEERLVGALAEQRARLPQTLEVGVERALDALPQRDVVRLEDGPLRALEDRGLDHVEEAADVDVLPVGVRRERAGAPDADAARAERAD